MLTRSKEHAEQNALGVITSVWVRYRKGKIISTITEEEYQEELEARIGERISARVPEEIMAEFDAIDDPTEAARWIERNLPETQQIIEQVLAEMEKAQVFNFDA